MESEVMPSKEELHENLSNMNRYGAVLIVPNKEKDPFQRPLSVSAVDSMIVVRAEKDAFWLSWKSLWYTEGKQFVHLSKIVNIEVLESETREDGVRWFEAELTDHEGKTLIIEMIRKQHHPNYYIN